MVIEDLFVEFMSGTDREEVLDVRLINYEDRLSANFYINKDLDFKNTTHLSDKKFLELKYKALVDLYLLSRNYDIQNFKEILINIKPDID